MNCSFIRIVLTFFVDLLQNSKTKFVKPKKFFKKHSKYRTKYFFILMDLDDRNFDLLIYILLI